MNDYPEIARDIAAAVEREVSQILKTTRASEVVGKGPGGETAYIDRKAEDAAITYLRDHDIACQLITEESGIVGEGDLTILLDPLDGSTNALAGIPFYAVSLAFWGEKRYGFVKNLCTQDIYEGFSAELPLKNGKKINPDCVASVASGYNGEGFEKVFSLFDTWRCFGSLALELCYVAEGSLMALVDLRKKARIVDIAGAQIIAEAQGLKVTDEKGRAPFADGFFCESKFVGNTIISALPPIHREILSHLHR